MACCKLPNGQTVKEFENSLVGLPANERVPIIRDMAQQVADSNQWKRAKNIEKFNRGRTIYTDGKYYYSVGTLHGRFEMLDMKKGTHIGEVDFGLNPIDASLDISGAHNIKVK